MITAQEGLDELHELVETKVFHEELLKSLNKKIMFLQAQCYDLMVEEDLSAVVHRDVKFTAELKPNFSLDPASGARTFDSYKPFMDAMKEIDPDIVVVKETIHAMTRNKILREMHKDGTDLPPGVKLSLFGKTEFVKTHVEKAARAKYAEDITKFNERIGIPAA